MICTTYLELFIKCFRYYILKDDFLKELSYLDFKFNFALISAITIVLFNVNPQSNLNLIV